MTMDSGNINDDGPNGAGPSGFATQGGRDERNFERDPEVYEDLSREELSKLESRAWKIRGELDFAYPHEQASLSQPSGGRLVQWIRFLLYAFETVFETLKREKERTDRARETAAELLRKLQAENRMLRGSQAPEKCSCGRELTPACPRCDGGGS